MSISRPFAYSGSSGTSGLIPGTEQVGSISVGFPINGFEGLEWWNGADEELGYVVCIPVPDDTQPTPVPGVLASLRFIRSPSLTEISFLDLVNTTFNQNFTNGSSASTWLTNNGYWNSYTALSSSPLILGWNNITNVPVGSASSVSNWNSFLDLPANGTTFSSVTVVGNNVYLYGGSNIHLKDNLFSNNSSLLSVNDTNNCIISAGSSCFQACSSVTTFDLPQLTTAGNNCFATCSSSTSFNLPQLTTAGVGCFSYCTSVTTFNLPQLTIIGSASFYECTSVTSFNLPACIDLGGSVGNDNVFYGITASGIILTVPSALMTCNSGNPDGDIQYLQNNNIVKTNPLILGWNNITNASLLVGDASDVSSWNTLFDLPTNGTTFSSVTIVGNKVNLFGGSNIHLKNNIFSPSGVGNTNLLSVVDAANCITTAGNSCFAACTSVTTFDLPQLTTAGTYCFYNCTSVTTFDLPQLTTAGVGCFSYCTSVTTFDLPQLGTAGEACFTGCVAVTVFTLPQLTTAGTYCFQSCSSATTFDLPQLTTAGDYCFRDCSSVTTFDLPQLTTAGNSCFAACTSVTTFDLPQLTTAGTYCFYNCTSVTTFTLPQLGTASGYCFYYCYSVTLLNLPQLGTAGDYCFYECTSVTTFDLPQLTTAGDYCFIDCLSVTTFDLPQLTTAGALCFYNCTSVTTFDLPSCTNLGGTVGNNNVFLGISGNTITLTVPVALTTCNGGNPDGDIQYLQANNNVTVNPRLTLGFDNITNVPVGSASSVSNWNTFFDLPTNGTTFSSVTIVGNNVELYGGSNIHLKNNIFSPSGVGNTNLLSVVDTANCITTAGDYCFSSCTSVTTFDLPQLTTAGDYCFSSCTSSTTFDLPQLGTAGELCFTGCASATTFDLPQLTTAGDYCFYECTSVTTFDLPQLTTAGDACFANCTSVTTFDLPQLVTAGNSCFAACTSVTTFDLPQLGTAGTGCFANCTSVTTFDLPQLTTAGEACFYECTSVTTFDLPQLTTAGNNCFDICTSVTTFRLPSCTNLGTTVGDDDVFYGITSSVILTVPLALMTCNSGNPDGDIQYLQANNNVTVNPALILGWNNITNVPVGSASNVSNWNTFFDLPANGTTFSSVTIVGNNVELYGGSNIHLKDNLFSNNPNLLSVNDSANSIISAGYGCFSYCSSATTFYLSSLTTAGVACFASCTSVTTFTLPQLGTASGYCFYYCYSVTLLNLPQLGTAGDYCFTGCAAVTTFTLPQLGTAGNSCFALCTSITSFNLPQLTIVGNSCFYNCTSVTTFDLPSCTNLGGTVGNNNVFLGITGKTMTLIVPSALMTCNSGNPDGDIQYLQANNNVTVNPRLTLGFDNITNVPVGSASSVSNWNIFFGLPPNGIPFTSVTIVGNNVELYGGSNIHLRDFLFSPLVVGNTNLLSVVDTNCIKTAGSYCFSSCTSVTTFDLPQLTTAGFYCFNYCTSVTTFDLPQLVTAGTGCFYNCTSVTTFDLPQLGTAGDYCFYECTSVTTFDLPQLTTAGDYCFRDCSSVTTFDLPQLGTAGNNCFYECASVTTFDLPQLTTAGNSCFYNCTSVTTFDLPSCTNLGTTVGDDDVFYGITSSVTLTVPSDLMTCNSGNPDGDILYLQANNTVTVNQTGSNLKLVWNNITNASSLVGDVSRVSRWNTFFGLPTNGTPFTSVTIVGSVVKLFGGSNIHLKNSIFANNKNLLSVLDTANCITTAGVACFNGCTSLTTFNLPSLTTANFLCFGSCGSITSFNLPQLTIVGNSCFYNCTSVTLFNLRSCTNLGGTVGNNNVFLGITGKTMTLIVPAVLMTCNSGNPDGDIQYLQANNTETIITV